VKRLARILSAKKLTKLPRFDAAKLFGVFKNVLTSLLRCRVNETAWRKLSFILLKLNKFEKVAALKDDKIGR